MCKQKIKESQLHKYLLYLKSAKLLVKKIKMAEEKKKIAIYPGTFDPVTNGHLDIVIRAKEIFDEVVVSIGINPSKTPLFSVEERAGLLRASLAGVQGVEVSSYSGLLVAHAREKNAVAIIRGLRALSDFEYEFQLALMNRKLADEISTVFLMPHEKYTYVNSSLIRNLAELGQDVSDFVPSVVQAALRKKFFN
ncbi:MAG: Phosphopantetheine adenylyltransferase [Ignavibacteriaceae bacterium]|nr:Phosphopantetheine adenylyltransferase [Ignavibacteriaceae bacterium]